MLITYVEGLLFPDAIHFLKFLYFDFNISQFPVIVRGMF